MGDPITLSSVTKLALMVVVAGTPFWEPSLGRSLAERTILVLGTVLAML